MTDILIAGGNYSYDPADPFKVTFSSAADLLFPFAGTLVIPRAPSPGTLQDELAEVAGLNAHDWLFYSFLYPRDPEPDDPPGVEMVFPTLRTPDNKPFKIGGDVLIWVEQDYTPLDDLHAGNLFDDIGNVYSARYPENITNSSRPKVLVIQLQNISPEGLPETMAPLSEAKGYTLTNHAALDTAIPAPISGTLYAFDLAGHQIDGYSALLALGVDKPIGGAPADHEFLVQFVDLHGNPLDRDALPVATVQISTPPLTPVTGQENAKLYRLSFTPGSQDRTIVLTAAAMPTDVADNQKYRYRSVCAGIWPGFGFELKDLQEGVLQQIDLKKDYEGNLARLPRFLRLCVFHPAAEFQTHIGGDIDEQGVFATNKFKLATGHNEVEIFNTGDLFFGDLYKEITEPEPGEELKAIYLANWRSSAHLFLKGNLAAYGIERTNADRTQIEAALDHILQNHVVVPIDKYDPAELNEPPDAEPAPAAVDDRFLLVANRKDAWQAVDLSFQVQIKALTEVIPIVESKVSHTGFVRTGALYAWPLFGADNLPFAQHQVTASWKNSIGDVPTTVATLLPRTPVHNPAISVPMNLVELSIDGSDPANAVLLRTLSYDDLLCVLAGRDSGCAAGEQYDDAGKDLRLLFLQLTSGRCQTIPLNPDENTRSDTGVQLHLFDDDEIRVFAIEPMAIAVVDWNVVTAGGALADALLTRFREIAYPVAAFQSGALPLSTHEWGGLLRQQIAAGVKIKALYWDHIQANLSPGLELDRGLSNSASLTEVINRQVNSKWGQAARDAATRTLGAFHQKGTVLVKEMTGPPWPRTKLVAYLGGMDLDLSRWDTEAHHHLDPERQSGGGWHDVQMKIVGDGALDVLRNFEQRWEALASLATVPDCMPISTGINIGDKVPLPGESGVPAELELPDEPGPFVQITRTIPPRSCYTNPVVPPDKRFVGEEGELGSLQTYLDMIRQARKFIVIHDQYLFSPEITLAIHEALSHKDGPEFAVIVLPKNLNEADIVDPLFYKIRQRAFHTLFYGAELEGVADPENYPITAPHRYRVNAPNGNAVRDKVAILTPINRAGDEIYVHSKQIIVDDVVMSIGSANFTFRGSTYEMELNASVAGRKLYKGGTDLVREQRIEICRRTLGLPQSYATLMQDWFAAFKFFKALETQTANDAPATLNLHPLKPMAKQLDPDFAKRVGGDYAGFNEGVGFVMGTDDNSPGFLWLVRSVLDVDGRAQGDEDAVARAARFVTTSFTLGEFPRNPPYAYGRVTVDLDACFTPLRWLIQEEQTVFLDVTVQTTDTDGNPTTQEPLRFANFALGLNADQTRLVIQKLSNNEMLVPILLDGRVTVAGKIVDANGDVPLDATGTPIDCTGTLLFDPGAPGVFYLPGSFNDAVLVMS